MKSPGFGIIVLAIFIWLSAIRVLPAGDTENWSLGPLGGTFQIVPGSHMLTVRSVTPDAPAATAGLQVGDRILGAFGEDFLPINGYFTGSVQDFGSAIDRAEANGGSLPLRILRPGTGGLDLTLNLPAAGAFGPAYPLGSPKFQTLYETSCAAIHTGAPSWFGGAAMSPTNGSLTNLGWMGLVMLSHPNWADTAGTKPYRNSINIMRDQTVAVLDNIVLAPVKADQPAHVNPGLENWQIAAITMFLAEYVNKTGDTSVMPTLQRACDALANRIQESGAYHGHMGHGGVEGDYGNWALNIINVHTHAAFAMAKRAGATINQAKWDLSWNVLKLSTARSNGHSEDGYVDYGPPAWGQGSGWDASARTAGSIFAFLNYGQSPTPDDTDALNRMKGYVARNYERFQIAHAYTVGGVGFYQLALPYLDDRAQRYIMDNTRFFYQFHRTADPGVLSYFGGRGNNGGDSYLDFERIKLYNAALAMAVANGGLPSMPAANPARIHAHMKSPWTRWPDMAAKTARLSGLSHTLDVDITDWQGTPMTTGYTAAWSQVSGPSTAIFGSPAAATTLVSFPSGGRYRLQLAATTGSYTVTELYDFDVIAAATPTGYVAGKVGYEVFSGISGTQLSALTSAPSFTGNQPDQVGTLTGLETTFSGNNYGQRVRGVIIPPVSGNYRFHIASDDASEFKLNAAGAAPGGVSTVCFTTNAVAKYNWTANASQQSALIPLTAGLPYAFEILHKEGGGADHCAVAWTGPGIASPTLIGSASIAMEDVISIVRQPVSRSASPGASANFDILVAGPGPFLYEWQLDGVAYWGQSTSSVLNVPNVGSGAAGTYTCVITSPSGTLVSQPAELSLNSTTTITGGLRREVWTGISGGQIANLTSLTRYPRFPDTTGVITAAETPQNFADDYGQRLSGWIVPPETGTYRFYLSSDDASQLWLSTDDTPANKVLRAQIGEWTNYRTYSASSSNLTLTAGQRYHIEVLHKEGGGGDHLSIAWQIPGSSAPTTGSAPIPGEYLECEVQVADPLSSGLVAWWRMDEAPASLALDSTSTAADAAISGATWTEGRRNGALAFNGAQFLSCGNRASLGGITPFSITAWIRVNSGNNQEGVILQQRAADGFDGQYQFTVNSSGRLRFYCYGNSAEQFDFSGATPVNTGQWVHVAALRDGLGNAWLYLNGEIDASVSGTTVRSLASSISMGIGADIRDSNRYFRGSLDDIRLFNRVLTQAEISDIRNRAPVVSPETIDLGTADTGTPFFASVDSMATDPDLGETRTWQKISGPDWLSISPSGEVTGTPGPTEKGANTFGIRVTDSIGASADATLLLEVLLDDGQQPVGPPWVEQSIGSVAPGNQALVAEAAGTNGSDLYTITGSGALTQNVASDGFHFISMPVTGDCEITARVASNGTTSNNLRAGVMIRENQAAGSRHASMVLRGTSSTTQPWFIYRAQTSATSSRTQGGAVAAPYWVRLLRAGDSFTAFISPDGSAWTQVGTQTIQMGPATLAGLAVSSGSTTASNTATFDNVTVKTNEVSVSLSSGPAAEGNPPQPATFVVSRGALAPPAPLAVPLVLSGTAGHPDDYSLSGGGVSVSGNIATINIPSGSESVEIVATPINDLSNEGTETLIVTIQNSPDYLIGAPSSAEVQILDQSVHELTVIGGTGGGTFAQGSTQPITASPPENYQFTSWTGTGIADPTSATTTVLIDAAKTVTANFKVVDEFKDWISGFNLEGADAERAADPDKDGTSNIAEMHLGMNPTDPSEHLRMTLIGRDGADLQFIINRVVTAGSFVVRSGDSPADWTHHQTVEVGADADNHIITLPSSGTRRFYQLVYTTPPP